MVGKYPLYPMFVLFFVFTSIFYCWRAVYFKQLLQVIPFVRELYELLSLNHEPTQMYLTSHWDNRLKRVIHSRVGQVMILSQHKIWTHDLILKNIVRGNVFRMCSSPDDEFWVEYNTEIGLLNLALSTF